MTLKTKLLSLMGLALLSGCVSTQEIVSPPVEMTFASADAQNSVQKYITVPSRTFIYDDKRKRVEATGTPCSITGTGFSANYTTPASLRLPVYGMQSSDVTMTCTYNETQRSKSFGIVNLTAENISNAGAGGGLIGAVVASGISAARGNRPNDNYAYRLINLDLNSKPKR